MNFPARLPKKQKRDSRWRSPKHRAFVRDHECSNCAGRAGIQFAHYRLGSGAGMGQKPDDYLGTSLCGDCHDRQHAVGEETFWAGKNVDAIIRNFIRTSPVRAEIERHQREKSNG